MNKLAFLLLVAAVPAFLHAQTDDFNDGNDAGWTRFNPIGVGSFSVVNGAYRLRTSPSPDPVNFGPGRAGSLRNVTYTDFYVTVDIVNWDTNVNQAFGILARCTQVGPGTTDGYAMTWDAGGRDLDISVFTNERPAGVQGQSGGGADLIAGRTYRMVFIGKGSQLTGEVYDTTNLDTPLASITGTDTNWTSGVAGLIVYDNTSAANGTTDTTFDNYFALDFQPPRLKIVAFPFQEFQITWPAEPTNYVLQHSSPLGNWTDITENITESGGTRSYIDSTQAEIGFYRLRP